MCLPVRVRKPGVARESANCQRLTGVGGDNAPVANLIGRTWRLLSYFVIASVVFVVVTVAHAAPVAPSNAPAPLCSWQLMSNNEVLNIAFPDVNATYWVLPYALGPNDTISLSGSYPNARYFSLNTYGTDLDTVDTLRDSQIRPDPGSSNPYVAGGAHATGRRWHATVVNRVPNRSLNEIRATPPTGAQAVPVGFLIIRVYVPDDVRSLSGGVALPTVTMRLGGATIPMPPCAVPFDPKNYSGPIAAVMTALVDRAVERVASGAFPPDAPEVTFINPGSTAGLFPNGDNKYIGSKLTYRTGRIAVIRGKAPSYPNTRTGASPAQAGVDMRYWSMCQNDKVSPYPVVACAADFQTRLDADGYYTYVVAAPADMTYSADPRITIIPWGDTSVPNKVVFLRNMLPSTAFYPLSVQAAQATDTEPVATMGPYYPRATYCDVTVFQKQGWQACYR